MEKIGNRLFELRNDNKLTMSEMSEKLGVHKSTITRYETGEIKPNLDMMILISKTFGVSLDWLAGFDVRETAKYDPVVKACIDADITPERLMQAVNLLKG